MKIAVFGPERRTGAIHDSTIVDLSYAFAKYLSERGNERHPREMADVLVPSDLGRLIDGGPQALENAKKALDYLFTQAQEKSGPRGEKLIYAAGETRLYAPRAAGSRVACAGGNFADHARAMAANLRGENWSAEEAKAKIRSGGIWGFWKVDRESRGHDAEITYPARARYFDYEGELAIVLGKQGQKIAASQASEFIWGVTLSGDWSIRGFQESGLLNFALSKNFDGSHSLGPCIVAGELDAADVEVETWVNGERRQHFNSRDMVFSFGEYLEYLSHDLTLYPGDVISGGTAAGTAADSSRPRPDRSFPPDRFLKPGDTVEIKSAPIGTLRARIVAGSES